VALGDRGRHPEGGVRLGERKAVGHDADDAPGLAAQLDRLLEHVVTPAETALPHAVRQYDDEVVAGLVLGGREQAAERGPDAEHVEQVGRRVRADQALGLAPARERGSPAVEHGKGVERRAAVAVILDVQVRVPVLVEVDSRVGHPDHRDPVGVRVRQRPQQHAAGHAEHGRAGADAERQRDDRHDREARAAAQDAERVADVVQQVLEAASAAHVVPGVLERGQVADAALRLTLRLVGRQAFSRQPIGQQIDMVTKLVVNLAGHRVAPGEGPEPLQQHP